MPFFKKQQGHRKSHFFRTANFALIFVYTRDFAMFSMILDNFSHLSCFN